MGDMSDASEINDESENNMSLSELKIKLYEEQSSGGNDWKSRMDDDVQSKSLSPSALSSDTSSVHSGRFDSEFCVGQRIEVKDYRTDTWYTAKVVEVDYDDREIFIHYERWSVRFDEWLKWDSQRIRKAKLSPLHHRFKVGEHVLATWSYTKKYPAAVKSVLPDDKYEVLFYDGFAKILKGNRITKIDPLEKFELLEKMPKEIPRAPPIGADLDVRNIGTKEERRQKKRRLNVVELLQPGKRRRADELISSPVVSSDTSPETPVRQRRRRQLQSERSSSRIVSAVKKFPENIELRKKVSSVNRGSTGRSDNQRGIKKDLLKANRPDAVEKETKVTNSDINNSSSSVGVNNVKKYVDDVKMKHSSGVSSSGSNEGSPSNMEKDSNSEQDFPGFDSPSLDIKTDDFDDKDCLKTENNNVDDNAEICPVVPLITNKINSSKSSSNISLPLPTVRRISKRGRIPKLKTSLGNITAAPRLSSFPKIKPRGRIYKPNEHTKNRGRVGKNRDKLCPMDSDHFENDTKILQSSASISTFSSDEKPFDDLTEVHKNELTECNEVPVKNERVMMNERDINNDLMMIRNGSSGLHSVVAPAISGSSCGSIMSTDNSTGNVFKQDCFQSAGVGSEYFRKKGRRLRRSFKKGDEKKVKTSKMVSRRKVDEDDDPERWNGDIPDGAKPVFIDGGDGKMRQSIIIPDKKLPPGWTKHTIIRKNSSKWDVLLVNPNGRKFRSRKDLRTYYNEMNKDYPEDCFDFVVGRTKMTSNLIEMETMAKKQGLSPPSLKFQNKKKDSKKSGSEDGFSSMSPSHTSVVPEGEKRVKTLMPKTKPLAISDEEPIVSAAAAAAAVTAVTTNPHVGSNPSNVSVPSLQQHGSISKSSPLTPLAPKLNADMSPNSGIAGGSTPDSDGAASWICPKESCGKHFRKENLLQMHIKHYHPEYNQFLDCAPNVADLAYARTVGEPLDETVRAASFLDRINRYEAKRKAKADGVTGVGSVPKKNIVYSPLRKALLKGLPSKDSSEHGDDLGDYITKIDSSPAGLQGKYGDGLERGAITNGDPERFTFDNERGRIYCNSDDPGSEYSNNMSSHSTLKELLSGNFDESAPNSPVTPTGGSKSGNLNAAFRFSKSKPLVSLEKLNVTTDSNGRILLDKKEHDYVKLSEKTSDSIPDNNEHELSADISIGAEGEPDDMLKKEEIINCMCGYAEEDGLMIQCDLCLCWQHGFCNNIKQESDVPEKYICCICRNPKKLRNSYKYSYNFDWLKEGKLPCLSFRIQDKNIIQQRESLLKRSHDLVSTLLQLQKVVKSLRLKTHIAGKSDHPKLYLWSKSWEKVTKIPVAVNKNEEKPVEIKVEDIKKVKDENEEDCLKDKQQSAAEENIPKGPQVPVPEAPIDLVECRLRLLEHIEDYQLQVESRLTTLESQIVALESLDPDLTSDESPDSYPQTKQTVQMLTHDLTTVRKVIGLN